MKYINMALFISGAIGAGIGFMGLLIETADLMLAIRLMSGGVVAMGISNILTETGEWWEELRDGV